MGGQIGVITNQIIVFAILMTIGFIAVLTKVFTKESLNALSKLIVKIILPALIFSIVAGSGVTLSDFLGRGRFAIAVVLIFALLFSVGVLLSKFAGLKDKSANVFIVLMMFGNMGFMGIPLIQELFKDPSSNVCISVYTIIDMSLLWTLGVYYCSRHQKSSNSLGALKNMINPTTVALTVAFVIMLLKISMPDLLMDTIAGIGGTSKYLTLIYIGGAMAFVSVKKVIKKPSILLFPIVKMLIIPVLVYLISGFFLKQIDRSILTIIAGLPSMTTIAMVASAYKSDDEYATEIIFVTTIASLLTIPAVSIITSLMN